MSGGGGGGTQEVTRMELVEFTSLIQIQIWPSEGRTQHRDNGSCPSALSLKPHNSLSLCMSLAPLERDKNSSRVFPCGLRVAAVERASGLVQVGQGKVSGSCQGGMSGLHQVNADTDLASWEEDSTQGQWRQCHTTQFLPVFLWNPPKLLSLHQSPR